MAQYTKHPIAAPPRAPEREATGHLLLRGWSVFVLIVALAPTAWQFAFGTIGSVILGVVATSATIAVGAVTLVRTRLETPFPWRRLPWTALGYTALAVLSIAWSAWRGVSAVTALLLVAMTLQGLLLAVWLTWRELLRALSSALKWLIGLSVAFELFVSVVAHGPILPNFVTRPAGADDPQWYWSRDNLFDGGRLQGIVGNANLLGALCLLALIVFALRLLVVSGPRGWLIAWIVLTAFLFVRAGSATTFLGAAAVIAVAIAVLVIRRVDSSRTRRTVYIAGFSIVAAAALVIWLVRGPLLGLLGRSADLTGREGIWEIVLGRAVQRPWWGWGHASPWLPWDPAFDGWIIDHEMNVLQAHNMWVDVFFQLGIPGLILVAVALVTFLWRAWFFAVDRPRWDLRVDRPYSPVTMLPILVGTMLVVQGFTESAPIMLWGWMLLVTFSFKMKSVPLVGVGLSERERFIERGERARRVR